MKLCSACLLGIECRYDGKSNPNGNIIKLSKKETLIPVCPEQLGGLSTPRKLAGIYLKNYVRTVGDGEDVTKYFCKGAEEVLKLVKLYDIKEVILKQGSPSCGSGRTWQLDKEFLNHKVKGYGITARLLKKNGIKVISEEMF